MHENASDFDESSEFKKVKENLRKRCKYWQNILRANGPVLNVKNKGYKISLSDIPKPIAFKYNHLVMYHSTVTLSPN